MTNTAYDERSALAKEHKAAWDNARVENLAAAERLQKKLRKLLMWSTGIMSLGVLALVVAISYKINMAPPKIADMIAIGPTSHVEDVMFKDDRLVLLVRDGEQLSILHLDPSSGKLLGKTQLVAE